MEENLLEKKLTNSVSGKNSHPKRKEKRKIHKNEIDSPIDFSHSYIMDYIKTCHLILKVVFLS